MDAREKLSFGFTPTKDDYVQAFRAFYFSGWLLWAVMLLFSIPQAILILLALLSRESGANFAASYPFVIFLILGAYLFFALVLNPWIVARKVKSNRGLTDPISYEVGEAQFVSQSGSGRNEFDWENFCKVIETREAFLLVYANDKDTFRMILKRGFASPDDEGIFRNLLALKIPKIQKSNLSLKSRGVILALAISLAFGIFLCVFMALTFFGIRFGPN